MISGRALLIFPPNWSACVYGPHLALPLLAGGVRSLGIECSVWDLTQEFLRCFTTPPTRSEIVDASKRSDYATLDSLYFEWEDQFVALAKQAANPETSGLLSGFSFGHLRSLPLAEALQLLRNHSP